MEKQPIDFPAMDTLTPEQAERINNNCFIVNHSKGEEIFSQEKPISYLMYINYGLVKLYKNDQKHRSIILRILGPGNFAGLFSVFYENRYKFSATALEACEMIYLNISLIQELIQENGRFSMSIIRHMSNDGMDLMNKLIYFPQKQVPGRIAEVLLQFAMIYKNNKFTIPLSRQELADYVYSTKESVSRTLTEFKNDRMIDLNDRAITLHSMDLLKILSKMG